MATQARTEDDPKPNPSVEQLLVEAQRRGEVDAQLSAYLDRVSRPARLSNPLRLTAAVPVKTDDAGATAASFGVLNPNPVPIYLGIGGTTPAPGMGALTVPPNSIAVLPFSIDSVQIGVDRNDAWLTGDAEAVVHIWRYETVQAAFMGSA